MIRIGVIDTGLCNRRSLLNALAAVGATTQLIESPLALADLDGVLLPGVGAFGPAMTRLRETSLDKGLNDYATRDGGIILGVCLGMQLLADVSEEGGTFDGLGLIPGAVTKLHPRDAHHRVPNIGWCDVTTVPHRGTLFASTSSSRAFYFAHSFQLACDDREHVAATIDWDSPVCAAVEHGNVFGVQFHPEKSQNAGLDLLQRFVNVVASRRGLEIA